MLVVVVDVYCVDIIDVDGNVVVLVMMLDNLLIGDVVGVNLIGVIGDDMLVVKFFGLFVGDYIVVVCNDESVFEILFD